MKARPVLLPLLLILSLVIPTIVTAAVQQAEPGPSFASHATQTPSSQDSIRLWRDASDDLWIATPFYVWNITGGRSITIVSDDAKHEWYPDIGDRVIDALSLSPQPGTPITSQVIFALPDEALIYLERVTPDGTEGLELAFRVSDNLIRLTHRWQGEDMPVDILKLQPTLATATRQLPLEMTGTLSANEPALLLDDYNYFVRFDPSTRQGYAMLQRQEAPGLSQRPQSSCPEQLNASTPTAHDPGQFPTFFLPGHVLGNRYLFFYTADPTAPLQPIEDLVARLQLELPDLNAASIMRTPRYDYDAPKNQPDPGDTTTFVARVANRGGQATISFVYAWSIDDTPVLSSTHSNLDPGDVITLSLDWTWQTGPHTVTLELDPGNVISEVSEYNNVIEDRTDALAVGFWVEQSVYDWFNLHQVELGLGSVSWDDWAQRQLRVWNQMFADAIHPLTPQGVIDRVRLDKVTVVPDGALPSCATNFPDPNDKTIDLEWGFPSELVGIPSGHTCGALNYYFEHPESQEVEYSLMHELSHARYLVDLYGLNIYVNAVYLSDDVDSTASTLNVDRDVENDGNFPLPAYLAIGGELVICQSKGDNAFVTCSRGAEGTTPRAHAAGTSVHLATVRLQDGQGNMVQGGSDLPVIGDWNDHLYFNLYPDDLMSGGLVYEQHSAYAWNRIAGQRPVCGNYNAPCNIGEYLNDLPEHNVIEVRGEDGQPLIWAQVEIYQGKPFPLWYGKVFLDTADAVYFTDSQGRADLGHFPFGDGSSIIHTFGHSNAVILLKISSGGETVYRFFEVTEANEAYWSGHQDTAIYVIDTNLPQGIPPRHVFLPMVLSGFPPPPPLLRLRFEGSFVGEDGEQGFANGPTFVAGRSGLGTLFDDNDTLYYDTDDNINREHGSIEFWLKSLWAGGDGQSYVFFEVGNTWFNRMRIMKDGANNFRFMVWSLDTEYDVSYNVAGWAASEWHHVRVTWQSDTITLCLDGVLRDTESPVAMPSALASRIYIGSSSWGDAQAQAVIDDFTISGQP